MRITERASQSGGGMFALLGALIVGVLAFVASSYIFFYFFVQVIGRWAESESPASFEGPLTAAGPLAAAAVATVICQLVALVVLARVGVPFAKYFLAAYSIVLVSVVAMGFLGFYSAIYFQGWYPARFWTNPQFPVLVITLGTGASEHTAQLVEWSQLKAFCDAHPDYSFIVPSGEETELVAQLPKHDFVWAYQTGAPPDTLITGRFDVTPLGNGRQKVIVSGSWNRNANASVQSWYEAEDKKVYPKYTSDGDTYGLFLRNAFLLVSVIDVAGLILYLRRRTRKSDLALNAAANPAQ